jgi:HAMP domain-containing protein
MNDNEAIATWFGEFTIERAQQTMARAQALAAQHEARLEVPAYLRPRPDTEAEALEREAGRFTRHAERLAARPYYRTSVELVLLPWTDDLPVPPNGWAMMHGTHARCIGLVVAEA